MVDRRTDGQVEVGEEGRWRPLLAEVVPDPLANGTKKHQIACRRPLAEKRHCHKDESTLHLFDPHLRLAMGLVLDAAVDLALLFLVDVAVDVEVT